MRTLLRITSLIGLAASVAVACVGGPVAAGDIERVEFASADGKTTLTGYLFRPQLPDGVRVPAVVMMHGRAGAYSTLAKGRYDASTLSPRHLMWGRFWAAHGFIAVLVDGFGPRGFPAGFPRHTYGDRPDDLNEIGRAHV